MLAIAVMSQRVQCVFAAWSFETVWIWRVFGMFQRLVYAGFHKVGQLLWRLATCGFGRKSSNTFEF